MILHSAYDNVLELVYTMLYALCMYVGCNNTFNGDFFKGSQYSAASLSLGFYAALWSYDGWLVIVCTYLN